MKQIIIATLMAITSYGVKAQETLIDIQVDNTITSQDIDLTEEFIESQDTTPVLYNQFRDYVEFQKEHQVRYQGHPQVKPMPRFADPRYRMFPAPQSIQKTPSKVVVIFDRKQWDAFQYMHRKMWMRRSEVQKQVDELRRKRVGSWN